MDGYMVRHDMVGPERTVYSRSSLGFRAVWDEERCWVEAFGQHFSAEAVYDEAPPRCGLQSVGNDCQSPGLNLRRAYTPLEDL